LLGHWQFKSREREGSEQREHNESEGDFLQQPSKQAKQAGWVDEEVVEMLVVSSMYPCLHESQSGSYRFESAHEMHKLEALQDWQFYGHTNPSGTNAEIDNYWRKFLYKFKERE